MEILIILFLILLNGIFAMSEIAMVSSHKSRLENAAKKGDKGAKKALELSRNPGKFLSTVQIGITLVGILTGIYSGGEIQTDLVNYLNKFEFLKQFSETIAIAIILITLTFFSLVFGELVPKRIGMTMPEKISKLLAFPMYWISIIAAPFIWLLTFSSDSIIKLFRIESTSESNVTEEEIKEIIQEGMEVGAIQKIEQDIMERVISLGDRKVGSLMTHRNDTIFLKTTFDVKDINRTVNNEMHSVYPVLNSKMDVEGLLLLKDLYKHINDYDFKITDHIKQPQYISDNLTAYEALKFFKTGKTHQAIVMDEFGQMQGIVTMNDLLEALVGEVSDFYGSEVSFIQRKDGSWLIDGHCPLTEFLRKFDLGNLTKDYPFDTISGLILNELRRIPSKGDTLLWLNFEIEILDMDGARIDEVLLTKKDS